MLGFGATGQFAIGQVGIATAETISPDKWYIALSEPPRFRPGLRASAQQFSALSDPFPFVSFGWFQELSKPQRLTRPALNASEIQFAAMQPAPSPFVPTGWFEALSEPVRKLPGLPAAAQQFFATDTSAIPISKLIEWFAALSEPPRFRSGLAARLQQFFAAPPQLRPNPTAFGVLAAIETKDVFLAGGMEWTTITSGEVGITANDFSGAEIGVAGPAITTVQVSIRIL
jgi:hypothetical protein